MTLYEKSSTEMNFTKKNKRLQKLLFSFIKSTKIKQPEFCQHCDFWVIHSLRKNHLTCKHILHYWNTSNELMIPSILHTQQTKSWNLARSSIDLSNTQKFLNNIRISSWNFQIYLLFLWFRELVKLIDLIKIFLIFLHMKHVILDALSISSMLNTFKISKSLFEPKWSKIFIIKFKHEKLPAWRALHQFYVWTILLKLHTRQESVQSFHIS